MSDCCTSTFEPAAQPGASATVTWIRVDVDREVVRVVQRQHERTPDPWVQETTRVPGDREPDAVVDFPAVGRRTRPIPCRVDRTDGELVLAVVRGVDDHLEREGRAARPYGPFSMEHSNVTPASASVQANVEIADPFGSAGLSSAPAQAGRQCRPSTTASRPGRGCRARRRRAPGKSGAPCPRPL